MLSELFKYGGVVTKTKAIKSKQMTDKDFEQLMQRKSLSEVVIFLKNNTHYSDIFKDTGDKNLHRGDIENPLKKYYATVLKKYYTFITDDTRKVIEAIFVKEEIEAIKDILRRIEGDKEKFIVPVDEYIAKHFTVDINKLSSAKSFNDFLNILSGTGYEKLMQKFTSESVTQNMFSLEMALDSYYFRLVNNMNKKLSDKKNRKVIEKITGIEIDIINIIWIYRCKKYYDVSKGMILTHLIPIRYKLTKAELIEMGSAEKLNDFIKLASETEYGEIFKGLEDESGSKKVFIETNFNNYFLKILRKLKRENPFSIVPVIEEIYSVNQEITRIINIVECIRYSLSVAEIKEIVN